MNILGIYGAIGWDGNITYGEFWLHGSGATLIMNGELKTAINEERFTRIKNEGCYPKLSIQNILDHNKLTKYDIDLVVYVANAGRISFELKLSGWTEKKLQEYFPNCKVEYVSHHAAHSAATFYTSGFDEANILSFDGSGDHEPQKDGQWLVSHMKFSQGKDLTLTEIISWYHKAEPSSWRGFGIIYNYLSTLIYATKMNLEDLDPVNREIYPGKIMGLAAFGDYQKIDLLDIFDFSLDPPIGEWKMFPQLHNSTAWSDILEKELIKLNPDDLAAWTQHQFEKYLMMFLNNIPRKIKRDNLCLGGGCALNILANSKIIEQGIYKNVHVNTAPNDDGLHFGAALYKAAEYEHKITLPDDIGYLGIPYTDEAIETALC
jgi:carbamoyltransferase